MDKDDEQFRLRLRAVVVAELRRARKEWWPQQPDGLPLPAAKIDKICALLLQMPGVQIEQVVSRIEERERASLDARPTPEGERS